MPADIAEVYLQECIFFFTVYSNKQISLSSPDVQKLFVQSQPEDDIQVFPPVLFCNFGNINCMFYFDNINEYKSIVCIIWGKRSVTLTYSLLLLLLTTLF